MKRSLIAVAIGLLSLTSCADYLTPDGEITEREIELPTAAEGIEITDGMRLVLDEAIPAGTAIIRTHENIQPYIKAETNRNRTIFTVDARRFKNLDVTITTSPAPYSTFTASGGSEIYSPEMQNLAKASFIISGGSHAKMAATCGTASIECSGGSEIDLTGASANADITCTGGSYCYGYDFATETANVDISGGSHLEITVAEALTGDNSGGSHIRYKGSPSYLNINNTGGSTTSAVE